MSSPVNVPSPVNLRAVFSAEDITQYIHGVSSSAQRFGGLSDIYQGFCSTAQGPIKVAIKFIRSSNREFAKTMRRHRREIRVWHGIRHPNILPLLGLYWDTHVLPAMVSRWNEQGTVNSYLQALPPELDSRLRESLKDHLLLQIALGLDHLHSHDPPIIHGDLKGDNILISDDGIAQICDFGLSTITGMTTDTLTDVRGTLRWMAPELVLEEDQRPSTASDMWAYGCVVIEIVSGSRPYAELASNQKVMWALEKRDIPNRPHGVSDAYWSLVLKCLVFQPARRRTAHELVHDPYFLSPPGIKTLHALRPVRYEKEDVDFKLDPISRRTLEKASAARYQTGADILKRMSEIIFLSASPVYCLDDSGNSLSEIRLSASALTRELRVGSMAHVHFEQFTIMGDLMGLESRIPAFPVALLTSLDVSHEDWDQCMVMLSHGWSGYIYFPEDFTSTERNRRGSVVTILANTWNRHFFRVRGLEILVLRDGLCISKYSVNSQLKVPEAFNEEASPNAQYSLHMRCIRNYESTISAGPKV